MTSRSDQGGRGELTPMWRRAYLVLCWSLLIVTTAAAFVCLVMLAGTVLQGILPS